ncbi:AzlD domain-containing protein [Pararhodospirillum oryzae]|uniref:Branched-chain amino acid ABC transporter n=1 Tax=Pararhodospirillum oryzae TaxID=478448 RepID=A0A512H6S9_9PROT|nr:AzlD domain-containing protein [Pararhodospirillum oryzae]GEO81175.1 hypothetical protein ROR02_13060 [Pararhodospirillum oryzae]
MASSFLLSLLGCAVVTVLVRVAPVLLLSHLAFPAGVRAWLTYVPAAVMAAILAGEFLHHPALSPAGWSVSLLAAGVSLGVGLLTRSLFLTVLAGVAGYSLLGWAVP